MMTSPKGVFMRASMRFILRLRLLPHVILYVKPF
jgi:hypothetical protein